MRNRITMLLRRLRKLMAKFYRGNNFGFDWKARPVGFRRIFPSNFVLWPYFIGDKIPIRIYLRAKREQKWHEGIIKRVPPQYPEDEFKSSSGFPFIDITRWPENSDTPPIFEFPISKWLPLTIFLGKL